MNAAQLKASILQQAIEGKLVPQLPEEGVVEQIGDAPTEVPFEIPASWKWVTIKNIVVPTKQKIPDKDFTYIDVSCISSFSVAQPKFISADKAPSRARKIVHPGMLLYATVRPYLKNICIAPEIHGDVIASTAFATFECNAIVFNRYLFYVLISDYMSSYAKRVQKGISYPAINDTDFYKTLIPLPPVSEQKRIVAKIKELMPLVEEYGKAYDKLQELNYELPGKLKASILQEAIQGKLVPQLAEDGVVEQIGETPAEVPFEIPASWCWSVLKDIADVKGGKRVPTGKKLVPHDTGYPYIRVSDMQNGSVNLDSILYLTEETRLQIKNYTISCKDVYVTVAGTIGRVGTVPKELDGANLTENADKIVLNNNGLLRDWVLCLLKSEFCQQEFKAKTTKVGQPKLAIKRIENICIPIPPLAEQKRIVAKVDTLLEQIDLMTK